MSGDSTLSEYVNASLRKWINDTDAILAALTPEIAAKFPPEDREFRLARRGLSSATRAWVLEQTSNEWERLLRAAPSHDSPATVVDQAIDLVPLYYAVQRVDVLSRILELPPTRTRQSAVAQALKELKTQRYTAALLRLVEDEGLPSSLKPLRAEFLSGFSATLQPKNKPAKPKGDSRPTPTLGDRLINFLILIVAISLVVAVVLVAWPYLSPQVGQSPGGETTVPFQTATVPSSTSVPTLAPVTPLVSTELPIAQLARIEEGNVYDDGTPWMLANGKEFTLLLEGEHFSTDTTVALVNSTNPENLITTRPISNSGTQLQLKATAPSVIDAVNWRYTIQIDGQETSLAIVFQDDQNRDLPAITEINLAQSFGVIQRNDDPNDPYVYALLRDRPERVSGFTQFNDTPIRLVAETIVRIDQTNTENNSFWRKCVIVEDPLNVVPKDTAPPVTGWIEVWMLDKEGVVPTATLEPTPTFTPTQRPAPTKTPVPPTAAPKPTQTPQPTDAPPATDIPQPTDANPTIQPTSPSQQSSETPTP